MAKKKTARKAGKTASRARAATKAKSIAKPATKAANGTGLQREIEEFLFQQAELLDSQNWQGFIDLFTQDGLYWAPATPDQTTGDGVPSIFYEDRDLMTVRMRRMQHPHAWSQKTAWGTNHLIGNIRIEAMRGDTARVRSRFHMMEFRNDVSRHFAGSYIHELKKTKNGWRIQRQRVDLVNGQGPYEYVLQAWV